MNKIYKVIWSKVKHQYVVVSELAHRDGKRSSAATTSKATWRALAAALVLTSSLVAMPYIGYAATGAVTTSGQYIAVAVDPDSGNDKDKWGRLYKEGDTRTFADANGTNHTYTYMKVKDDKGVSHNYWVRKGYTITIVDHPRYDASDGSSAPTNTYVINATKSDGADDGGLISSSEAVITDDEKHTTLTGVKLNQIDAGMYGGAVNTGSPVTPKKHNYYINDNGNGYKDVGDADNWDDFNNGELSS